MYKIIIAIFCACSAFALYQLAIVPTSKLQQELYTDHQCEMTNIKVEYEQLCTHYKSSQCLTHDSNEQLPSCFSSHMHTLDFEKSTSYKCVHDSPCSFETCKDVCTSRSELNLLHNATRRLHLPAGATGICENFCHTKAGFEIHFQRCYSSSIVSYELSLTRENIMSQNRFSQHHSEKVGIVSKHSIPCWLNNRDIVITKPMTDSLSLLYLLFVVLSLSSVFTLTLFCTEKLKIQ